MTQTTHAPVHADSLQVNFNTHVTPTLSPASRRAFLFKSFRKAVGVYITLSILVALGFLVPFLVHKYQTHVTQAAAHQALEAAKETRAQAQIGMKVKRFAESHTRTVSLVKEQLLHSLSSATQVEQDIYASTGRFNSVVDTSALALRFPPAIAPSLAPDPYYGSWDMNAIKLHPTGFTLTLDAIIRGRYYKYTEQNYPSLETTHLRCMTTVERKLPPITSCTQSSLPPDFNQVATDLNDAQ